MEVPWVLHVTAASTAFPVVTGILAQQRLSRARWIVFAWAALATAATIAQRVIAYRGYLNLWLSYVTLPGSCVLALAAFALWQTRELPRQMIRAAIPVSLVAGAAVVFLVEDTRSFSAIAAPMFALVGLGASLLTLVTRASDESDSLTRQDWFWITTGMALYFGALAALMPMARLLIGAHQELVARAWQIWGASAIVANVAIAVGMLCPNPSLPQRSGASSSRSPSASGSLLPPS